MQLLDLEGLFEQLGQMIQNGRLAHNQGHAGGAGGSCRSVRLVRRKGDDGNVLGLGVLLQPRDRGADVVLRGSRSASTSIGFSCSAQSTNVAGSVTA